MKGYEIPWVLIMNYIAFTPRAKCKSRVLRFSEPNHIHFHYAIWSWKISILNTFGTLLPGCGWVLWCHGNLKNNKMAPTAKPSTEVVLSNIHFNQHIHLYLRQLTCKNKMQNPDHTLKTFNRTSSLVLDSWAYVKLDVWQS